VTHPHRHVLRGCTHTRPCSDSLVSCACTCMTSDLRSRNRGSCLLHSGSSRRRIGRTQPGNVANNSEGQQSGLKPVPNTGHATCCGSVAGTSRLRRSSANHVNRLCYSLCRMHAHESATCPLSTVPVVAIRWLRAAGMATAEKVLAPHNGGHEGMYILRFAPATPGSTRIRARKCS
jgi:hypothetical protein